MTDTNHNYEFSFKIRFFIVNFLKNEIFIFIHKIEFYGIIKTISFLNIVLIKLIKKNFSLNINISKIKIYFI